MSSQRQRILSLLIFSFRIMMRRGSASSSRRRSRSTSLPSSLDALSPISFNFFKYDFHLFRFWGSVIGRGWVGVLMDMIQHERSNDQRLFFLSSRQIITCSSFLCRYASTIFTITPRPSTKATIPLQVAIARLASPAIQKQQSMIILTGLLLSSSNSTLNPSSPKDSQPLSVSYSQISRKISSSVCMSLTTCSLLQARYFWQTWRFRIDAPTSEALTSLVTLFLGNLRRQTVAYRISRELRPWRVTSKELCMVGKGWQLKLQNYSWLTDRPALVQVSMLQNWDFRSAFSRTVVSLQSFLSLIWNSGQETARYSSGWMRNMSDAEAERAMRKTVAAKRMLMSSQYPFYLIHSMRQQRESIIGRSILNDVNSKIIRY